MDPIRAQATKLVHTFDHNRNGVIDLSVPQGQAVDTFLDETLDLKNQVGRVPLQTRLFHDADANRDQRVTVGEVERVLRRFDTNGDGRLATDAGPTLKVMGLVAAGAAAGVAAALYRNLPVALTTFVGMGTMALAGGFLVDKAELAHFQAAYPSLRL